MRSQLYLILFFLFSGTMLSAQTDWERLYPFEHYGRINQIYFLENDVAYASCEGGTMMRSNDGGQTWPIEIVAPKENISYGHMVFFDEANPDHFIYQNYSLQLTTDGGQTFSKIPMDIPGGIGLMRDVAITPTGRIIVAGGSALVYSDDLGENWTINDGLDASFGLHQEDATTYFLATPGVYRSTDNGTTYELLLTTTSKPRNIAIYGNHIWVDNLSSELWHSSDEGETWEQVQSSSYYSSWCLFAQDETHLFNATNNRIYASEDGGVTWNSWMYFPDNFYGFNSIDFDNDGELWIGGASKRLIHAETIQGPFDKMGPGKYEDIRSAAGKGTEIWGAGTYGMLLYSGDSGQTWTEKPSGLDVTFNHVFDGGDGFRLIDIDGIVYTLAQDGTVTEVFDLDNYIYSISTDPTTGQIYAISTVSNMSTVWRSDDGGITWTQATTLPVYVAGVHALGNGEVMVHTIDGELHHSMDQGNTWTLQASLGQNLNRGLFLTNQLGWMITQSQILSTTDGGLTTTAISRPYNAQQIMGQSADQLWVLGLNGNDTWIYSSTDGGLSWDGRGSSVQDNSAFYQDQLSKDIWILGSGLNVEWMEDMSTALEDQPASDIQLKLWPNPVQDQLQIDFLIDGQPANEGSLLIWNEMGQQVYQQSGFQPVQVANWPSGTYTVQVMTEHRARVERVVVVHD